MRNPVVLAILGFVAQLVDGASGMAYGVTSTTLLLAIAGLTPALASTVVHISRLGRVASGLSHWRAGNVDWSKIAWLAIPGAIGAFVGATVLVRFIDAGGGASWPSSCSCSVATLARFAFNRTTQVVQNLPIPRALPLRSA